MSATTPATAKTSTRLQGRALLLVRLTWIVLVAATLALFFITIPDRLAILRTLCETGCEVMQLSPAGERALLAAGLSLDFSAILALVQDVVIGVVFSAVGLIIFWRRSDDWMAALVALALVVFGVTAIGNYLTLSELRPAWGGLARFLSSLGFGLFLVLFFLFPNGQPVPRWMRWLVVAIAISVPSLYFTPFPFFSSPWMAVFLALTGPGVLSQIYRYRRVSGPVERQQTKWVIFGFVGTLLAGLVVALAPVLFPSTFNSIEAPVSNLADFLLRLLLPLPMLLIPLSLAFSGLRYRLWDIDFVINRSLVYGALTALLAAAFAAGFFALRAVVEVVLGGQQSTIAIVAATAIVVLLFNPTRRWLRAFVDRRFYGIQIDYTPSPAPAPSGTARATFGPYTALEFIGRGGMAEVYRAAQPSTGKTVAVKIMSGALTSDVEFRKRFEREAKTASALQHPNIVRVMDFGEQDHTPYMVMEFIGGGDLGDHLKSKGRLPLAEAQPLIKGIASALDYAHAQGLVHRDIKPSNVMLDGPRPVLTDFGIAKIVGGHTRYTQTGGMLGTFDYIAPEQIQGAANVDGRADVYAFGVMVYQMLAGELPFKHQNPGALLIAHMTQPPPDARDRVPELPRETAHALQRALAKNPAERFATAGEFAAALP